MGTLIYIRLVGYTGGTLLMLFWMVVILGYRRQRNFERVFFFLCLALFLFYGGGLLALNSEIYYAQPPAVLTSFAWTVLTVGLIFLPPLVSHLHLEYAGIRSLLRRSSTKHIWLAAAYAPALYFGLRAYGLLASGTRFDFLTPSRPFGRGFEVWIAASLWFSAFYQQRFARSAPDRKQALFHRIVFSVLLAASLLFIARLAQPAAAPHLLTSTILSFLPILPFAALIYYVQRFNFLQIGRQQNLLYAVSATFLALLYLSLVRRLGLWLEPILPPEATAAVLLFVLVIFVEPIQRLLARRLHQAARQELESVRGLINQICEKAREGNLPDLVAFVGQRVKDQFEFEDAWLEVSDPVIKGTVRANPDRAGTESFSAYQPGLLNAVLCVRPHGAMLSGEVQAALELLCEQLPASIDLCRLIGEKLQLERELAERERLAALGQMAASISHNLKNPLGSIKTILQVQLENPEMPDSLKSETQMVLAEISRLSNKLAQLLQFSRSAVLGDGGGGCDAADVVKEVTEVLHHEAERKGIQLKVSFNGTSRVVAGREALSDILSNLVVNALEAAPSGGTVDVSLSQEQGHVVIRVEDNGGGISPELREKVLQPFFTTKTQGTGLGLAIVAKRIAEANGTLQIDSPITGGRGTRFSVRLPLSSG